MLLVIFGAGASYDSVQHLPPPSEPIAAQRPSHLSIRRMRSFALPPLQVVDGYPMLVNAGRLIFPALAIPVEGKDEFSCPKRHVERLRNLLAGASRIMTIGWRATEAHFLEC